MKVTQGKISFIVCMFFVTMVAFVTIPPLGFLSLLLLLIGVAYTPKPDTPEEVEEIPEVVEVPSEGIGLPEELPEEVKDEVCNDVVICKPLKQTQDPPKKKEKKVEDKILLPTNSADTSFEDFNTINNLIEFGSMDIDSTINIDTSPDFFGGGGDFGGGGSSGSWE